MHGYELVSILGVCFFGAVMVVLPFLLHHQRKMAEMMHGRSEVADELSKRLDTLTEAVFQLATRVEHATTPRMDRGSEPPAKPDLAGGNHRSETG